MCVCVRVRACVCLSGLSVVNRNYGQKKQEIIMKF